jgi:hypothetical protein
LGSIKLSQAPASPWFETDVGNVGVAGGAGIGGGTFTLQGAGATIYGAADGFHFLYLPLTNDCTLIARVVDTMPTSDLSDGWDKAGLMIREALAPDAKYCMVMMTSGQGCALQYRTATGGATTRIQALGLTCPYWVKLARAGNVFTASYSPDGNTWTQLDVPATVALATNAFAGLAVSARNTNLLDTATFDSVSIVTPPVNHPVIQTISVSTDGLVFTGTGETNATYYLLGTTNLATPLTNWTRLLTNQFDGSGHFNFTNPFSAGLLQQFYILQLP